MFYRFFRHKTGNSHSEECFYVKAERPLEKIEINRLKWVIAEPLYTLTDTESIPQKMCVEKGPRKAVETAESTNRVSMCRPMGVPVIRMERSVRYSKVGTTVAQIIEAHLDPMTEELYETPLTSFDTDIVPADVIEIPVLEHGEQALIEANARLGFGMDKEYVPHYVRKFVERQQNPTDVGCHQLGNNNSDHSRHGFFGGLLEIDGEVMPETLMQIVKEPLSRNPGNNVIGFGDNAGAIRGSLATVLFPRTPGAPTTFQKRKIQLAITLTAETHNHPCRISAYPGAETGVGGLMRDAFAPGQGGIQFAGIVAGYCSGNPDEIDIPGNLVRNEKTPIGESPLSFLLKGSAGACDYGNKLGVPRIGGFTRAFGQYVEHEGGEKLWREYRKPILYCGALGRISEMHLVKSPPKRGMKVVAIGGPAYRIGVSGGAASSMLHRATTDRTADFMSVQRGDPEMENKVLRVIRACTEMLEDNPIESIHDQGAGGPSNVLTELMDPAGGRVDIRKIVVADSSMSLREIWVAEYQERFGLLLKPERMHAFQQICERERVNCEVLGEITGDGKVVVFDSVSNSTVVDFKLEDFLTGLPQKIHKTSRVAKKLKPLDLPRRLLFEELKDVFRQIAVGSKHWELVKADTAVTGLVVRGPRVGPKQLAIADAGVTADSYFSKSGAVESIGENPNRMLINPAAGARMAVAEMLTNMAGVKITKLGDIKCRANWMWPAKIPGEAARMYDAAKAMRDIMLELKIAINGGKDSSSMASEIDREFVPSPGELVIFGCASVPNIEKVVTPDFKGAGNIGFIDLAKGKARLGGSALAQSCGQLGDESPDIDDVDLLARAFAAVQRMVEFGLITAHHDRSDGGLIAALAEMCMAGNCGATIVRSREDLMSPALFAEEAGMIFEYDERHGSEIAKIMKAFGLTFEIIGFADAKKRSLELRTRDESSVFKVDLWQLRLWYEDTSTRIELKQANPDCVNAEWESYKEEGVVEYRLPYLPRPTTTVGYRPKVAVLREEGTNGDREMIAAWTEAGCEPTDINMVDILGGKIQSLEQFQVLALPGGFSYADVFGSARGWAGVIRFHPRIQAMFDAFHKRTDTLTLGVCNGCQLMAHLGLATMQTEEKSRPLFVENTSGRFESRWVATTIQKSHSVFLRGMEGTTIGIWVQHGEGRVYFPDQGVLKTVLENDLAPIRYVDLAGIPTEQYPYNPNGSPYGIAALCSPDGRRLAMMPHPERAFKPWQMSYWPNAWRGRYKISPWLTMFQNARNWCVENRP